MKLIRNNKNGFTSADFIQILCVLYISIWTISPPLAIDIEYRVVAIFSTFLWMCIELVNRPSTFFSPTPPVLCSLLYVSCTFIVNSWFFGFYSVVDKFQIYIFVLFMIFYESYRKKDIRQLRVVFWLSMIVYPFWLTSTIVMLKNNPYIVRASVTQLTVENESFMQGAGGFGLVYSTVIMIPVLLYLLKNINFVNRQFKSLFFRSFSKLLVVVNLLMICIVIVMAQFTIAIILMFVGIISVFLFSNKKYILNIRSLTIVIISLLVLLFSYEYLFELILNISKDTMYEAKVYDIVSFFDMNESVGTFGSRVYHYRLSINYFLENPIFGAHESGGHSAILDHFASYGIFVGTIFMYIVCYLPFRYMLKFSDKTFGLNCSMAFCVLLLSFLNPVPATVGFSVFIFYPVAIYYIQNVDGPGVV